MGVIQINNLTITESLLVGGLQLPKITLDSWSLQSVGGNYDNSCTALVHKDKSEAMAVIRTTVAYHSIKLRLRWTAAHVETCFISSRSKHGRSLMLSASAELH